MGAKGTGSRLFPYIFVLTSSYRKTGYGSICAPYSTFTFAKFLSNLKVDLTLTIKMVLHKLFYHSDLPFYAEKVGKLTVNCCFETTSSLACTVEKKFYIRKQFMIQNYVELDTWISKLSCGTNNSY